jgi:rhomboid protease GluP
MAKKITEFQLDGDAMVGRVRSLFFSVTAAYAAINFLIIRDNFNNKYIAFNLAIACYFLLCILLFKRYKSLKINLQKIVINESEIVIPNIFSKNSILDVHKIKSIERLTRNKNVIALIIGVFDGPSVFMDRRIFPKETIFEEFEQSMTNLAKENSLPQDHSEIISVSEGFMANDLIITLSFVFLWVAAFIMASNNLETIEDHIVTVGAITKSMFSMHEFYRIASSFFLHKNIPHIISNIFVFSVLARSMEGFFGRVRLINIVLLSALFATIFSVQFSPYALVIGASGGVFGLFGAYIFINFKYQKSLPGSIAAMSRRYIIAILSIEIILEIFWGGIDISSHIGGFIFGIAYVALFLRHQPASGASNAFLIEKIASPIVVTLYLTGLIYFFHIIRLV